MGSNVGCLWVRSMIMVGFVGFVMGFVVVRCKGIRR